MDGREMKSGVIPLRHASLPGHVKLPRRYEKAAMGTSGVPARVRKISIQPGMGPLGDRMSDRLEDLGAAMCWVQQELIMLRQHDILLKRQFFHIQHSIQSLHKQKRPSSSSSDSSMSGSSSEASSPTTRNGLTPSHRHPHLTNGDIAEIAEDNEDGSSVDPEDYRSSSSLLTKGSVAARVPSVEEAAQNGLDGSAGGSDFPLDTYVVRASSSVTMLNGESDEEEDGDTFCEDFFPRPRTSSMKTSRDMAALARRRGSKELI